MRTARRVLGLDGIDVVHVGDHTFPLADGIRAVGGRDILTEISPL